MGTLLSQKQFENNSTMQKEDVMTILVTLKSIAIPTPRSKPTLNLLHRVITARDVSTTRFILFRKRTSSSSLKCPSIFHANFQDLSSHHKHFEGLLDAKAVLEGFELPKDGCLKDYTLLSEHQDSDSNFEQSEGGDEEEEDSAVLMNGLPCHDEVAAVQERKKCSEPTTVHRPTSVVHIKMDIDVSPSSTNDPSDVAIIEDLQTHRNDVRPLEPTQRSFCSVLPPAHGRHCYTGCIQSIYALAHKVRDC
ncbi:hypothetical protein AcV7_001136 [Taiwanofungus camphoratus]|nr:hypothetical protein AcV7_001136 [Antrodia cinnamomea]